MLKSRHHDVRIRAADADRSRDADVLRPVDAVGRLGAGGLTAFSSSSSSSRPVGWHCPIARRARSRLPIGKCLLKLICVVNLR